MKTTTKNLKASDKITVNTEVGSIEISGNGVFVIKADWEEDLDCFRENYKQIRVGLIDDLVKREA
jgi:hypothetical protein